jgi:membrane-bound serine protease (ClpP class)
VVLIALGLALASTTRSQGERIALLADVEGAIGPATSRFVGTVLSEAQARAAQLVVLRMDTPGGLSDSMREIIKAILGSPVPVLTFVAPSGARAASAGTYILYASHVAAMAPGTNLGAATPVRIGPDLPLPGRDRAPRPAGEDGDAEDAEDAEDADPQPSPPSSGALEKKAINDAVAYIRSLADLRGRNAEWAERAVREAASLPAREALEQGVIDLVAADVTALLAMAHGRTVDVRGSAVVINTEGLTVQRVEPSWQIQLLSILTNPNFAFILMMIGVYGLIFEFANPGSIGPGVIGVICLLLGLYALNMLPLDYTGLGLLLLGIAFMVAEAFTPTLGILGLGGLVAFVLGASLLLDSDSPQFRLSWQVIAATGLASAALLAVVLGFAVRAQRRPVTTGAAELVTEPATVIEWQGERGYVRVRGERWRARGDRAFEPGARVTVTSMDGLVLEVSQSAVEHTGETT